MLHFSAYFKKKTEVEEFSENFNYIRNNLLKSENHPDPFHSSASLVLTLGKPPSYRKPSLLLPIFIVNDKLLSV